MYIPVDYMRLRETLGNEQNYEVYDFDGEPVLSVNLPYRPVTEKFYITYYSMFPYLPSLAGHSASLTQAMPSYGHLLFYFKERYNEKLLKSLSSMLLAGF